MENKNKFGGNKCLKNTPSSCKCLYLLHVVAYFIFFFLHVSVSNDLLMKLFRCSWVANRALIVNLVRNEALRYCRHVLDRHFCIALPLLVIDTNLMVNEIFVLFVCLIRFFTSHHQSFS